MENQRGNIKLLLLTLKSRSFKGITALTGLA